MQRKAVLLARHLHVACEAAGIGSRGCPAVLALTRLPRFCPCGSSCALELRACPLRFVSAVDRPDMQ